MKRITATVLILLVSATACREPAGPASAEADPGPAMATITGTLGYRERVALTNQAEAEIVLIDVSRQDVAATVIAKQVISDPGQVPIRFELSYRPAEIDDRRSYSVRAKIRDRGRLMFTSDTNTPVITRGGGREAHLMLVGLPPTKGADQDETAAGAGMDLEGMFRYMADAPLFRDCRTGKAFPVAMEGAYIELERAYLNSGIEAGQEVMVRLRGRYLERPSMEGNRNEVMLIVDTLKQLSEESACAPEAHAQLQNTYWKLIELEGNAIVTPEGMQEIHVILSADGSRAHGSSGCNRFFGGFETREDHLSFSALGSTMMACPQGMDTEQAFLGALGRTTRYEISGQFLTLYADETPLARLEAIYL